MSNAAATKKTVEIIGWVVADRAQADAHVSEPYGVHSCMAAECEMRRLNRQPDGHVVNRYWVKPIVA